MTLKPYLVIDTRMGEVRRVIALNRTGAILQVVRGGWRGPDQLRWLRALRLKYHPTEALTKEVLP